MKAFAPPDADNDLGRARRRKPAFRAGVDHLEERSLLSVTPVGPETLVNTTVAGDQGSLTSWSGEGQVNSVAADASGNYVVAWEGNGVGDGSGVFAQRYLADGTPRGSEFRVNAATADNQVGPVVAMDHAGDFAVAWSTRVSAVGGNLVVYARAFNADGTARTGDIQVTAASTSETNFAMSIALDAGGDFVVLTDGATFSKHSSNSGIIKFHRYNALGQAQGSPVQVDDTTLINGSAAVAMDDLGNFAVAWNDTDTIGARVQRFDASGKKAGALIATGITPGLSRPAIAMDGTGRFAVTAYGMVRSYDANGAPQGPAFDFASQLGYRSAVAVDTQGNAVVSWSDYNGGTTGDVYGERISPTGTPLEPSFVVNTTLAGVQTFPSVATTPGGGFVVVWTGSDNAVPVSHYDVYAQQFTTASGNSLPTDRSTPVVSTSVTRNPQSDWTAVAPVSGPLAIPSADLAINMFTPGSRRPNRT
jgi:hypothetical protein